MLIVSVSLWAVAVIGILSVAGELLIAETVPLFSRLRKLNTMNGYNEDDFMAVVDWDRINKIMKKYCPEALGELI